MSTADSAEQSRPAAAKRREVRGHAGLTRRGRRFGRRLPTCFALAALLGAVSTAGLSLVGAGSAPALGAGPEITGAGSSYAAVALTQWTAQMATIYGDTINYSTSSSVIGLNEYGQNQVDFGASEIGYSTGQMQYDPKPGSYQYLPDVAGATCLMFNLNGRLGNRLITLKLDSAVMADIFTGTVTKWNAPQIAAINHGVLLPSSPIVAVYRSDASGENYIFSQYLDYLQPHIWQPFVQTLQAGSPVQAVWPTGTTHGHYQLSNFVAQSGSDGASNFVAATPDSITYVETAYAIEHQLPCAYVENADGNWVQPSATADAIGLERAELLPDLEQKLQGVYSNPLPAAYPISAYSYLVTPKGAGSMSPAKGQVLGQFIRYFACSGQNSAAELGYSPLPPNLVDEDFAAINRIPGAARAPTTATAQNCQDPYVDGQTVLPGEPCIQGQVCHNGGGGTTPTTTPKHHGSTGGSHHSGGGSTGGKGKGKGTGKSTGKQHASKPSKTDQLIGSNGTPTVVSGSHVTVADGLWPGEQILPGAKPGSNLSNGQVLGDELGSQGISLLGVRLGAGTMGLSVLLLVILLALPPTLASVRKRRKLRRAS